MQVKQIVAGVLGIAPVCTAFAHDYNLEKVSTKQKPNVIIILTDDQAMNTMNCWGGSVYTPNIDRLANEGMKFTRAYAASSISAASRYSILTGRYPGKCSGPQFLKQSPLGKPLYIDNTVITLEPDRPNLAKSLKQKGYTTGMVGKWHLGQHFHGKDSRRKSEWEAAGLQYYLSNANPKDPKVKEALLHNHDWYSQRIKSCGFDYADNIYWGNLKGVYNTHLNYHNIDWSVEGAIDFMNQAKSKPFFLFFSTTLDHGPSPQRSVPVKYKNVTSKGICDHEIQVLPERASLKTRIEAHGYDTRKTQEYTLWLDDAVGALMKHLQKIGQEDNTLVVFLTDHGIKTKASLYEGGIHIPMMMWWKGHILPQKECNRLISTVDLAPTIMSIAGYTENNHHKIKECTMDGVSAVSLFQSPAKPWSKYTFSEIGNARCIQSERYKYIAVRYPENIKKKIQRGLTPKEYKRIGYIRNQQLCSRGKKNPNYFAENQLYDLQNDPKELHNLWNSDDVSSIQKEMVGAMKKHLASYPKRPFGELSQGK